MEKLIQYGTKASLYSGEFGGQVGWPAAGMGYIFVTEGNRLLVVDGGHGEDAAPLLALMREITGEEIPSVALWVITHPHLDHYGALCELGDKDELGKQVSVERVAWRFPPDFRDKRGKAPCEGAECHMERICEALGAVAHTPAEGESITVGGLTLTLLFVPQNGAGLTNPNSLSLIFWVKAPRKTVLITGDACPVTLGYCAAKYGHALKSDILQLPHHGLCDTGHGEFYRLVGAETLLVPISEAGDRAMRSGIYGEATRENGVAEAMARVIHRAYDGTVTIEL